MTGPDEMMNARLLAFLRQPHLLTCAYLHTLGWTIKHSGLFLSTMSAQNAGSRHNFVWQLSPTRARELHLDPSHVPLPLQVPSGQAWPSPGSRVKGRHVLVNGSQESPFSVSQGSSISSIDDGQVAPSWSRAAHVPSIPPLPARPTHTRG
jgi:hypothetical protein